jgi:hypothetical protein
MAGRIIGIRSLLLVAAGISACATRQPKPDLQQMPADSKTASPPKSKP